MVRTSREQIMAEALRLFGERGFAATTIAQIEEAAGLSPGAGGLYRHFRSKDELLVQAVESTLADRDDWAQYFAPDFSVVALLDTLAPDGSPVDRLMILCQIGLARLDHNRDVTRILMRDNSIAPEVLEAFRRDEYLHVLSVLSHGLAALAGPARRDQDWDATAVVVLSSVSHFWLMRDTFGGQHPAAIDADRYLRSTAEMIAARLEWTGPEENSEGKEARWVAKSR